MSAAERLEWEHGEARKGLARMQDLARDLRGELEEKQYHALSLKALKNLEEIEELSRAVRRRLRR